MTECDFEGRSEKTLWFLPALSWITPPGESQLPYCEDTLDRSTELGMEASGQQPAPLGQASEGAACLRSGASRPSQAFR